ncbi:lytic transglycosylase domain-containing protein [Rhodanobacter sp. L36]|uniref:lytic transglycosylase domain-containing protein n=1 Tax=Rhodanobacter sp. L36 TaxID=1747221 RepID=UPI00131E27C0|nr:lytic transglycosylase domain-containing protein [Rhodanobacter sp. L36]
MLDVASHGGSVKRLDWGFPFRSILYRVALACALLSGMAWCSAATAGALYHCTGVQGEIVYSSSTAGYHDCKKISTFGSDAPRRRVKPLLSSLVRVEGSVDTTARDIAMDTSISTSLARVQGSAETSARALGDVLLQRTSLAWVRGSADTTAKLPLAAVGAGTPGHWSYHESHSGAIAPVAMNNDPASRVLRGAVYRIVRADGSVEYTNLPSVSQKGHSVTMLFSYIAECLACNLHSPIHWGSVSLNLTAYADVIRAASTEYGVDEAFLRAIIHAESAFNPRAMSLKGAQGLMQLMPSTASDMGVLDAFNTDQNIRGGARYLSLLLHDFNGNEQLAAAAYNAGPGAVQRYSGVPPYAETQVYVVRVGALRKRYGAALHPPLAASGSN